MHSNNLLKPQTFFLYTLKGSGEENMDMTILQMLSNTDNTTIVLFFYMLYRLEGINTRLKRLEEEFGIKRKGGGRIKFFLEQIKQSWNGSM